MALADHVELLRQRLYHSSAVLLRRDSKFVSGYLKGLSGVEIGASASNNYFLDTLNVDRWGEMDTPYKKQERRMVFHVADVDVVAPGDDLPFENDSHDFVFSSHVIEHFPDPIRALVEWHRVARRYIVAVVPHKERMFDRDRPTSTVDELLERHRSGFTSDEDRHWSVWTCETFREMCEAIGLPVIDIRDPDDKIGDGFAVVLDASGAPPAI